MKANETQVTGESPSKLGETTYEDSIAVLILGKLALYGYLHPSAMDELSEVKRLMVEAMTEGLEFYGEREGLAGLINQAELCRLGRTNGGAQ